MPKWSYDGNIGLGFPDSDAEIVLHNNKAISKKIDVNYLVEDVEKGVRQLLQAGCHLLVEPFDIRIGKCAVIKDPFGVEFSILDMTKGMVKDNFKQEG